MRWLRSGLLAFTTASAAVIGVDLGSKLASLHAPSLLGSPLVIFNPNHTALLERLALCAAALIGVAALAWLAARRGLGSVVLLWIGCGMAVGGTLAQGISALIWPQGVPDFIWFGRWVWNPADFAIGWGLIVFFVSLLAYPVLELRRRRAAARTAGPAPPDPGVAGR